MKDVSIVIDGCEFVQNSPYFMSAICFAIDVEARNLNLTPKEFCEIITESVIGVNEEIGDMGL